jgi:hypothetical protein
LLRNYSISVITDDFFCLVAVPAYVRTEITTNNVVGITRNVTTVSKTDKPGADVTGPSNIVMV